MILAAERATPNPQRTSGSSEALALPYISLSIWQKGPIRATFKSQDSERCQVNALARDAAVVIHGIAAVVLVLPDARVPVHTATETFRDVELPLAQSRS